MLLSVVIPVYNSEKSIVRSLESLLRIKEVDIEFIVVDDGSTDASKSICEEYAIKDKRFRIISQPNGGVSKARNAGIRFSKGKYISFLDADDELTEEFEEILSVVKAEKYEIYGFNSLVITENGSWGLLRNFLPGENDRKSIYNNFLSGNTNSVCNNIYNTDIIHQNNILFREDMKMGEDCVFNATFLQFCKSLYYIKKTGYNYYHDNKGSASYANKVSYLKDYIIMYEYMYDIYNSMEGLKFEFTGDYYIENVFRILRFDRKSMSYNEKKSFRESMFYGEMMSYNSKQWKNKIKKCLIMKYMYF